MRPATAGSQVSFVSDVGWEDLGRPGSGLRSIRDKKIYGTRSGLCVSREFLHRPTSILGNCEGRNVRRGNRDRFAVDYVQNSRQPIQQ